MSGMVILMTLIGGLGTFTGPVIGAFIVVMLENKVGEFGRFLSNTTGIEWFKVLGESVTIVIGLIFIICVMKIRPITMVTARSEEHKSELQSLMRNSYAVLCLKK